MLYIPVAIFRLFTSLYMLSVPAVAPATASVTQQYYEDYSRRTSSALTTARTTQLRYHASCDLQPNFRCASGDYCIPVKLVLNGYKDCPDASDEDARKVDFCKLGPAYHRCDVNSRCITTAFGYQCQCNEGYAGDGLYCERFPMGIQITVSTNDTLEDTPVHFNVSIVVFPYGQNSNLSLTVIGLPPDAKFDIGSPCNITSWCFNEDNFSYGTYVNAEFFPPRDFSGIIPITIIAEIFRDGYWVTGYSATSLNVIPVPDAPVLRVGTVCYADENVSEIQIPVTASVVDSDGSEELEIDLDGLPTGFDVSTSRDQTEDVVSGATSDTSVTTLIIKPPQSGMIPFNATISAVAKETSNGRENATTKTILIAKCPPEPNMNVIFDFSSDEIMEGQPIPLRITVKFELDESPRLISIQLINFTLGASLSRGHRIGNSSVWVLSRQDLADEDLFLIPPPYFSGELRLLARSEALYRGFLYNLQSEAVIPITPVAATPVLNVHPETICLTVNATSASFTIDASLMDVDGSESLIVQYKIPEDWTGSVGDPFQGSYSLMTDNVHEVVNVTFSTVTGFLYPVEIPVVIMALEKDNADQKIVFTKVKVTACEGTMQAVQPQGRSRTTIIWNVTTPKPALTIDIVSTGASSQQNTTQPSLPPNHIYGIHSNISSKNLSETHFDPKDQISTEVPEAAASSIDMVREVLDSAQDDESPRFNRNFSFLEITSSPSTTPNPTTRGSLKVQRLARPSEITSTRPTRPRPSKKGKQKGSQPGRAEMGNIKLEQAVTIANGTEDVPVPINISVITRNAPIHSAVQTRILGLPVGSYMTKGRRENATGNWLLDQFELSQPLLLYLPTHLSGKFLVNVTSSLRLPRNKTLTAREEFYLRVRPETDSGHIEITSPYFTYKCIQSVDKKVRFTIRMKLEDNDGSEDVDYLEVKGLPKGLKVQPGRILGNDQGYLIFGSELPTFDLIFDRNYPAFQMILDAYIREKGTGVKNSVTKQIPVVPCSSASSVDTRRWWFGLFWRLVTCFFCLRCWR